MIDPTETLKGGVSIVGEIMKAAGDNPAVKEAGANLGQTAVTLTKTINNVLMPLAAINYAFDKAHAYFSEKFPADMTARAATIPREQLIAPRPSVAGPALQGLAFTHEEKPLREMFLSLLATSMDQRVSTDAHPAFVEIIKQLTAREAILLKDALSENAFSIIQIRLTDKESNGWNLLLNHVLDHYSEETSERIEEPQGTAMVDNWIRLGLVEVTYSSTISGVDTYDWIEKRPEYQRLCINNNHGTKTVTYKKGRLSTTAFGLQFAKATGII